MKNFLTQNMWNNEIHRMRSGVKVKVISQVVGTVYIKDLNRYFKYNVEESVNALELTRSNDLQNAIKKNWIKLVNRPSSTPNQNRPNTTTSEELRIMMQELKKDLVDEIVNSLMEKLPHGKGVSLVAQGSAPSSEVVQNVPESVDIEYESFVSLNAGFSDDATSNIDLDKDTETRTVSDDAVKASLAKIKKLKKK